MQETPTELPPVEAPANVDIEAPAVTEPANDEAPAAEAPANDEGAE